ncbi:MAG TPA: hypothetical protein VJ860_05860 [Polyangia bacterium]|jgi:hypothetical protein|nr:hypothetical protein [Polyangia bacterium]
MSSFAHRPTWFSSHATRAQTLAFLLGPLLVGCETGPHMRDGAVPLTQRVAEVSVRLDVPTTGAPALSALAFRAEVTDRSAVDVLGVVDPLVAPAPDGPCELRDVAGQARALRAQGGAVILEELSGVSVTSGPNGPGLRPAPRVYPPLAEVVGGVIAEAGPVDIAEVPPALTLELPGPAERPAKVVLTVPGAPRVFDRKQVPLAAGSRLDASGDLVLQVTGPERTFLEIRPYGAPVAVACSVGAGGLVVVSHDLLVRMAAAAGGVPVSLEAVWRESRMVVAAVPITRVSVEVRSSTMVDLRP